MSIDELVEAFTFEGVNRANAVVNFSEEDPIDPKALWLNSQHIYAVSVPELAAAIAPVFTAAGYRFDEAKLLKITPLIQERIKTLNDAVGAADFFFVDEPAPYDPCRSRHPRRAMPPWRCGCWKR
ncbi:MAG: hypothetical protein QM757_21685 [Paludibaculum sp.]